MATITYAVDLRNAEFPMLPRDQTRTVIGARVGEAPSAEDKPHLLYAVNVMPTEKGYSSIGFLRFAEDAGIDGVTFTDARTIYDTAKIRMTIGFTDEGHIYKLQPASTPAYILITNVTIAGFNANNVSIADVNGVSYIYYPGLAVRTYTSGTNTLNTVVFTGLSLAGIIGIAGSSGYLIAHTTSALAWSSTIDPTDFVPSAVTGAGGGNVAGIAGDILFVVPNSMGLLIYTNGNVVAATYTGNVQYPFKLREVAGSKGGLSRDLVAYEANMDSQFSFTKGGLQAITSQKAELVLPNVSDFLAGRLLEEFDELSGEFYSVAALIAAKKLKLISSRFLCISYGETDFDYIIVYDIALNKLGKIKYQNHADIYEFVGVPGLESSRNSIAILTSDGASAFIDPSAANVNSAGTILLGKMQYVRDKLLTILEVEVENLDTASENIEVYSLKSMDGKTTAKLPFTESYSADNIRKYVMRNTAKSHTLGIAGKFDLTTVHVSFSVAGDR